MAIAITSTNCIFETGFDYVDLLSLSGIFGIHPKDEYADLAGKNQIKLTISKDGDTITIGYQTPEIKILTVKIDIKKKEIEISYFIAANKEKHVGFPRFIAQVEAAQRFGFKKISLLAYGNIDMISNWDGYIVWGKYGFIMTEKSQIDNFNELMTKLERPDCRSLNELVTTPQGTELWKNNGDSWWGEFDLDKKSESMRIFNAYRRKRNL